MKKFISVVMSVMMVCMMLLSVSTDSSLVEGDSGDISSYETSETLVSKNMETGEISYKTYYYDETSASSSLETYSTESWFPNVSDTVLVSTSFNGGISTNGVIGSDGRSKVSDTEVEPYSAICYVESTWSDGSVSCGTAFIIYSDVALTAAHMVYDADLGEWAEEVKLWPGKDGYGFWNNPYGTTTASNMVVSKSWTSSEADDYDWAILDLEDSIGDETGWFGISTSVSSGTSVTISGYPYDYRYYQYKMSGTLSSVETRKLYYSIDTSEGQSGSPIYRATTSGYTAYGIHTTVELENGEVVENSGARITSQLYEYCVEHMG